MAQNFKREGDPKHISLGWSIMRAQVLINMNVHTSFQIPTFIRSKDMTGTQKQKIGLVRCPRPFRGAVLSVGWKLL